MAAIRVYTYTEDKVPIVSDLDPRVRPTPHLVETVPPAGIWKGFHSVRFLWRSDGQSFSATGIIRYVK